MNGILTQAPTQLPGGPMSEEELKFCLELRAIVRAMLDLKIRFGMGIAEMQNDFQGIRKFRFSVDDAIAAGFKPVIANGASAHTSPSQFTLSALEREFLLNLDGFLTFALTNGLTFPTVLEAVVHDVHQIAARAGNIECAVKDDCFLPKVSGWARRNAEPAGDILEPLG